MLSRSLWTGMTIENVGEEDRDFVVITGLDYRSPAAPKSNDVRRVRLQPDLKC